MTPVWGVCDCSRGATGLSAGGAANDGVGISSMGSLRGFGSAVAALDGGASAPGRVSLLLLAWSTGAIGSPSFGWRLHVAASCRRGRGRDWAGECDWIAPSRLLNLLAFFPMFAKATRHSCGHDSKVSSPCMRMRSLKPVDELRPEPLQSSMGLSLYDVEFRFPWALGKWSVGRYLSYGMSLSFFR